MNNNDERDYAEEAANSALLAEQELENEYPDDYEELPESEPIDWGADK